MKFTIHWKQQTRYSKMSRKDTELLLIYLFFNTHFKPKVGLYIKANKTKAESSSLHSLGMQSCPVAGSLEHFHYWEKQIHKLPRRNLPAFPYFITFQKLHDHEMLVMANSQIYCREMNVHSRCLTSLLKRNFYSLIFVFLNRQSYSLFL